MLYRPIWPGIRLTAARNQQIGVRPIARKTWVCGSRPPRGWSEIPELEGQVEELGQVGVRMPGAVGFLAELNGEPIATGNLIVGDGVAILTGACTVPEARKQGAQFGALEAGLRRGRVWLRYCHDGSGPGQRLSQRNAERHGFRIAYTRIKWRMA